MTVTLTRIPTDLRVDGQLYPAGGIALPNGCVADAQVPSNAGIGCTKLQEQACFRHRQLSGTAVVAAADMVGSIHGTSASIVLVRALVDTVATGADRTVTVDVKKSTGGGAFATVLTSTVVFNNASAARTWVTFSVASANLADGDVLQVTAAVAGAAGNQAQGLLVEVYAVQVPSA